MDTYQVEVETTNISNMDIQLWHTFTNAMVTRIELTLSEYEGLIQDGVIDELIEYFTNVDCNYNRALTAFHSFFTKIIGQ